MYLDNVSTMKLPKLSFEKNINFQEFVRFWSDFYKYPRAYLYLERIGKKQYTVADIEKLFEWKNGIPLSQKKKAYVKVISKKINIINKLKLNFDMNNFQNEFKKLSAIWKIYLLHIIAPQRYPIFDQHVCRTFYFLKYDRLNEIPSSNVSREKLYFEEYLKFFDELATQNISRKKMDEAFWAFGKFLKTIYGTVISSGGA